ncbi:HofP DNA utilization family protein [uncultured Cedecea sp.]|uniref:HofP DNA utilization family protein n=1 Tax=uncultured Cedecea sp. TaxID=988762 RepID=UPI002637A687|nr:HofP DNA utilization family protein [uncultured Cedecea sp.]
MKISSGIFCLGMLLSLELHVSIRNPFVMPLSRCDTTLQQLDGWRLQGVIVSASRSLALMTDSQQRPLRVAPGSALMAGVTITNISRCRVSVSLTEICDGAHYHWYLSGGKNDKESRYRSTAMPAAYHSGKPSRHSDSR